MLDFLGAVGSAIMTPLYYVVTTILVGFHRGFSKILGSESGWAWALAIVGLTVVIRVLLIPLFVKQIKSSRNMQMLQPQVKELQKKYGHDKERMAQETMKLYQKTGTNPFSSCMPLLLQAPIFFALFRTLNAAAHDQPLGILTTDQVDALANARIFGARISDTFMDAESLHVRLLTIALVIIMTMTTFATQRQLMRKNMPESALTGPYAQQQKILLYVLPVVFAVGGIAFPVGVLLYWTTSNVWTMGQQFYVIRNNPAPGTPAYDAKEARDARKSSRGKKDELAPVLVSNDSGGDGSATDATSAAAAAAKLNSRNQPKKVSRSKRRSGQRGTGSAKAR